MVFIIEDTNNNKFGGYVNAKIEKYNCCHQDKNAFLFSLKSNGRLNGMMKFEIQEQSAQSAFWLGKKNDSPLFYFGGGVIYLYKESAKTSSYCQQSDYYFNFHGVSNAFLENCKLNGSSVRYVPKRFIVLEMK